MELSFNFLLTGVSNKALLPLSPQERSVSILSSMQLKQHSSRIVRCYCYRSTQQDSSDARLRLFHMLGTVVLQALTSYFASEEDVVIWFDIFCNNQHKTLDLNFDWWCVTFKDAILSFGRTRMAIMGHRM